MVSRPRCPRMPKIPRGRVDGLRLAHGEMVGEVRMAERSPEVEGSRPENDRMSWRNPDRKEVRTCGFSIPSSHLLSLLKGCFCYLRVCLDLY